MKSHWIMVWHLASGATVHVSTRDGGLGKMAPAEARAHLANVLRPNLGPLAALVSVEDRDTEEPNLIFTAQVERVVLVPDQDPEDLKEEADRHLRAVRDLDPGTQRDVDPEAPGGGLSDRVGPPELGTVSDILRHHGFRSGLPPAGLDRHA